MGFFQVAIVTVTVIREKIKKIKKSLVDLFIQSGEGGTRTRECFRTHAFQACAVAAEPLLQ